MEKCSASLVIKKIQMKTTVRCHYAAIKVAYMRKAKITRLVRR
jgi:DNA-directed RNA polymerase subunit RPC12/RpoP